MLNAAEMPPESKTKHAECTSKRKASLKISCYFSNDVTMWRRKRLLTNSKFATPTLVISVIQTIHTHTKSHTTHTRALAHALSVQCQIVVVRLESS